MTIYNSLYAVVVFSLTFLSEAILQITIFKEPPTICYKNSSFIKKKKKKIQHLLCASTVLGNEGNCVKADAIPDCKELTFSGENRYQLNKPIFRTFSGRSMPATTVRTEITTERFLFSPKTIKRLSRWDMKNGNLLTFELCLISAYSHMQITIS